MSGFDFETGEAGNVATTHDWLTPPKLLEKLGVFDLDPCASLLQPWRTATTQYTIKEDGLSKDWRGRVWCNPPYGNEAKPFLARCAEHGDAITLTFARTETKMFFEHVWGKATALLFVKGRINFIRADGGKATGSGAPSVLIAYGDRNAKTLEKCSKGGEFGIKGAFVVL